MWFDNQEELMKESKGMFICIKYFEKTPHTYKKKLDDFMWPILWLGKIWDKQILGKTAEINLTRDQSTDWSDNFMNHKINILCKCT